MRRSTGRVSEKCAKKNKKKPKINNLVNENC